MRRQTMQVDLTALLAERALVPTIRYGSRLGRGLVYPRPGVGRLAAKLRSRDAR